MKFSRQTDSAIGWIFVVCIIHMLRVLFTRQALNPIVFLGDEEVRVAQMVNPAPSQMNSKEADFLTTLKCRTISVYLPHVQSKGVTR